MENTLYIEIFGAVTGLLYVWLEIIQKRFMWILGGISALTYIVVFIDSGLYGAGILQSYYLIMSVYGWIVWGSDKNKTNREEKKKIIVNRISLRPLIISIPVTILAWLVLFQMLIHLDGDPMPGLDALTTVLSMLATYWVTRRYLENWAVWIVTNGLYVYIYISQGLYPTSVLYLVYMAAAVAGYLHWRKFE